MEVRRRANSHTRPVGAIDVLALQAVFIGRHQVVEPELGRRLLACALAGLVKCDQVGLSRSPVYDVELTDRGRAATLALGLLHAGADRELDVDELAELLCSAGWWWEPVGDGVADARETLRLLHSLGLARRVARGIYAAAIPPELARQPEVRP